MSGGYIEINDTDSNIRGTMAGVDGTFSGTFDSNNIDAISNVNVRDGAVSAYYHFHFAKNSTDVSFTVLKQPFTSIVDIVIPVSIEEEGDPLNLHHNPPTTITVYKNDALFSRKEIRPIGSMYYYFVNYISAIRIVDFNVESNTTYRIIVNNKYGDRTKSDRYKRYYSGVDLQGLITVGFRKR